MNWQGEWTGEVVQGLGFVYPTVLSTTYDPSKLYLTTIYDWDIMYKGAYDNAYNAGRSETSWDDFLVVLGEIVASFAEGSDVGQVDYSMICYGRGLKDSYWKGRSDAESSYYY